MAKRLTEFQKEEIIQSFFQGKSPEILSQEFQCSKFTIIRNLKKIIGESKYKDFLNKEKKSKEILKNNKNKDNENLNFEISKTVLKDKRLKKPENNEFDYSPESFWEITPIDYGIEDSQRKELSSIPISEIEFPQIVYMIVDKKIELEIKLLKDFPQWEFLPIDDLNRKTIEIFFDLKIAKRFCNKDQKVIKVPNTNVFKIVAPILISRGISRIVSAEKLIAL